MGMTFLQKIQELTKVNAESSHQELRTQLIQDLKNRVESAARSGKSNIRYCNFYDQYPELEEKKKDYMEVLKYFQQEGFKATLQLNAKVFIYYLEW